MIKKICSKCKVNKEISNFRFVNGKLHPRYYSYCKVCEKKDGDRYYLENKKTINEKMLMYRKKNIKKIRIKDKNRSVKYRIKNPNHGKLWKQENKEKVRASGMICDMVRRGKIKRQPCYVCGTTKNVHGHHPDYSKPNEVVWVCPIQHKEEYKKLKQNGENHTRVN